MTTGQNTARHLAEFRDNGYTIIESLLDESELATIRSALEPQHGDVTLSPVPWTEGVVHVSVIGGEPIAVRRRSTVD